MRYPELPLWSLNKSEICIRIAAHNSRLKIILKTKDDPYLLKAWIEHHRKIVGYENLIVFDNMSTNDAALSVYEEYRSKVFVVQFSGFHNFLHQRDAYPDLFRALKESCDYFSILDTDERLIIIKDQRWFADAGTVNRFIESNSNVPVFPGTWLANRPGSEELFECGLDQENLGAGIIWGKPIFSSKQMVSGSALHNMELREYYRVDTPANFFVLHLHRLNSQQRINSNINKLIARGFATKEDSIADILKRDVTAVIDSAIPLYVNELRELSSEKTQLGAEFNAGTVRLCENGSLDFFSSLEADIVERHLHDGVGRLIQFAEETASQKLISEALQLVDDGDLTGAQATFLKGIERFPDYFDQFGHPRFRKELVRLLLKLGEWDDALKCALEDGGESKNLWHEILFARAYTHAGNISLARDWWLRVVAKEPNNSEARNALSKIYASSN